jgi:hypothetical protein
MTTPRQFRRLAEIYGFSAPPRVDRVTPPATPANGATATHRLGRVYCTTLTLTAAVITITDADAAGAHGSLKVMDFNQGAVRFLGATCDLAITAAAGISATGAVVCGIGTAAAATDNATLAGTEQNIIPSTSVTLAASAGAFKGESTGTEGATTIDGTTTAVDVILNTVVSATDATASSTLTVTGTITLHWVDLGDN